VAWGLTKEQAKKKNITNFKVQTDSKYYTKLETYYNMLIDDLFKDDASMQDCIKKEYTQMMLDTEAEYPSFIYPFLLLPYCPETVEKTITTEVAWRRPSDTGGVSSNCTINKLQVYLKRHVYGDERYKSILENMLNKDHISAKVYEKACMDCENNEEYLEFVNDLDITLSIDEIIDKIKSYQKSALLRKEQFIGV